VIEEVASGPLTLKLRRVNEREERNSPQRARRIRREHGDKNGKMEKHYPEKADWKMKKVAGLDRKSPPFRPQKTRDERMGHPQVQMSRLVRATGRSHMQEWRVGHAAEDGVG